MALYAFKLLFYYIGYVEMRLNILSDGATVQYVEEMMTLNAFVNRIACLDIPNTEEPAINIHIGDQIYDKDCKDEMYLFIHTLADNLATNSYLFKPKYEGLLQKIELIKDAYCMPMDRRIETRGNITKYVLYSVASVHVEFENGYSVNMSVSKFLKGSFRLKDKVSSKFTMRVIPMVLPPEIQALNADLERYKAAKVEIKRIQMDGEHIVSTLTNNKVRRDPMDIFLIIQYTDIYPRAFATYSTPLSMGWKQILSKGYIENVSTSSKYANSLIINCTELNADVDKFYKNLNPPDMLRSRRHVRGPPRQYYIGHKLLELYLKHCHEIMTRNNIPGFMGMFVSTASTVFGSTTTARFVPTTDSNLIITEKEIKENMTDKTAKEVQDYLYMRYCDAMKLPTPTPLIETETPRYLDAANDGEYKDVYEKLFGRTHEEEPKNEYMISSVDSHLAYSAF